MSWSSHERIDDHMDSWHDPSMTWSEWGREGIFHGFFAAGDVVSMAAFELVEWLGSDEDDKSLVLLLAVWAVVEEGWE